MLQIIVCTVAVLLIAIPSAKSKDGPIGQLISEKQSLRSQHLNVSPALQVEPKSCPKEVKCVPPIQCPAHLWMLDEERPVVCGLMDGTHGLCCTTGQNHTTPRYLNRLREAHNRVVREANWNFEDIRGEARREFHELDTRQLNRALERLDATFHHNSLFGSSRMDVRGQNDGIIDAIASKKFKEREDLSVEESQLIGTFAPHAHTCATSPPCHAKLLGFRYRSIDGVCNNPNVGAWGAAKQPMERLVPPAYEDGVWQPRVHALDGSLLVSPRTISGTLFPDSDRPHAQLNLLTMQFGQFLSHDVTQSGSTLRSDGSAIGCCIPNGSGVIPQEQRHFACLPIVIPNNDPFYSRFSQRCMNFVRSQIVPNRDCKFGYAKQLVKVTHFIDGSEIYGSDAQKAAELRSQKGGRLIAFHEFNRELLPLSRDQKLCASLRDKNACFNAGDTRVNQIVSLTTIHTLFLREHNRIAGELLLLNPHWTDEILYQETKRIVTAILQHITYNEYLPAIVGRSTVQRFDLQPRDGDYSRDYDPAINPAVTNEFVGAAFRFGHSTVDNRFLIRHPNTVETMAIPDVFFNPVRLRQAAFFDQMMTTLTHQPMQSVDNSVARGLSQLLFKGDAPFGLDLISLNIQRGRDWALRPYNEYLAVIGFQKVKTFQHYGPEVGAKLASVYRTPDDIDLYVGGLLETAREDAVVGPTFSEIIADQFARLRKGDRFFYEHGPEINPGSFTPQQLTEIRRITMSRLICNNLDRIAMFHIQPSAFIRADVPGNEPIHCDNSIIQRMDLSPWKESR